MALLKNKTFLDHLPHQPGVYQMLDEQRVVLYVGKARDLKQRVSSYFSSTVKDIKTLHLLKQAKNIEITLTHTEPEALLLECFLIKKHQPRYNVLLRDDKSYPYILITDDKPYPRILFYRGVKKGKGLYFGPYPHSTAVREAIHFIQKLFHLRGCNNSFFSNRMRPCLHYQIGLCSGPCTGLISPHEYQQNVNHAVLFLKGKSQDVINDLRQKMENASLALNYEYAVKLRNQIRYLEEIQERQYVSVTRGNADIIGLAMTAGMACVHLLSIRDGRLLGSRSYYPTLPRHAESSEIISAFLTQHYVGGRQQQREDMPEEIVIGERIEDRQWLEQVLSKQGALKIIKPLRGERCKWLEMAETNAKQSLTSHLVQKSHIQERIAALAKAFHLKKLPQRIECFDISHTMGEATVASCVVFNGDGPLKKDYRCFNITDITPGDDIAAMRQVIWRRFNANKPLPDLVLIDGGEAQLAAAEKILVELKVRGIVLAGVAKGEARKPGLETLYFLHNPPLHLPSDSMALHFIQQIRDEAHRFAITGHRKRRDKKRRTSILESIPGIGIKRRQMLLRHFAGLQAIEMATMEQLLEVPGIVRVVAEKIYERFHK